MTKIKKFILLVKEKFNIDLDEESFRRTYAGHWQRSHGAWSWVMYKKKSVKSYGSSWSITEHLKHKNTIKLDGDEFFPD